MARGGDILDLPGKFQLRNHGDRRCRLSSISMGSDFSTHPGMMWLVMDFPSFRPSVPDPQLLHPGSHIHVGLIPI